MKRVLLVASIGLAQASYDAIAGYQPGSGVTDHNAIDLDQLAFENLLDDSTHRFDLANDVYNIGGNSRSQVVITLGAQIGAIVASGTTVYQAAASGGVNAAIIQANTRSARAAADTTLGTMRYPISDTQATYVGCRAGTIDTVNAAVTLETRAAPDTSGCFHPANPVCIGPTNPPRTPAEVTTCTGGTTGNVASVAHNAGRTIRGFTGAVGSTGAAYPGLRSYGSIPGTTYSCPGCPYKDFIMAYNYFGSLYYSDEIVLAALGNTGNSFAGTAVTWGTGSPAASDFPVDMLAATSRPTPTTGDLDSYRVEVATKGTVYLTILMYAIREFEDAIDDCTEGNIGLNDDPVHAWDEGVAFYTGSLEGVAGTRARGASDTGILSYNLADYRCQNFATCTGTDSAPNSVITGPSSVNIRLHRLFSQGQTLLQMGLCTEVRPVIEDLIDLLRVPLIQGTLRYVYRISNLMANAVSYNWYAEGGIFAASVLPVVHFCSASAATTIATNINLGGAIMVSGGGNTNFANVKAAFESVYTCMNITCADVGGFVDSSGVYYTGAEPCTSPPPSPPPASPPPAEAEEVVPTWAIAIIAVIGVLFLFIGICFCYVIQMEKSGKPLFVSMAKSAV